MFAPTVSIVDVPRYTITSSLTRLCLMVLRCHFKPCPFTSSWGQKTRLVANLYGMSIGAPWTYGMEQAASGHGAGVLYRGHISMALEEPFPQWV